MNTDKDFMIVSAADAGFAHLLDDLLESIRNAAGDDLPALGVLDVGLETEHRNGLEQDGVTVVEPDWDYKVPDDTPPYIRAQTARPHLPKYFPGYEQVMWMDADTWVQKWDTIGLYRRAAAEQTFAVTPEIDRTYSPYLTIGGSFVELQFSLLRKVLSKTDARELSLAPMINSGVFCAHRDAPHWDAWDKILENYYSVDMNFLAEQTALNIMLYTSGLQYAAMPSRCNWCCARALPKISADRTTLLEAGYPHDPLGIVHLTAKIKNKTVTVLTTAGAECETRLHYSDVVRLREQPYNLFPA